MNLRIDKSGRMVLLAKRPSIQLVDDLWVHQGVCTMSFEWNSIIEDVRENHAEGAWAPSFRYSWNSTHG